MLFVSPLFLVGSFNAIRKEAKVDSSTSSIKSNPEILAASFINYYEIFIKYSISLCSKLKLLGTPITTFFTSFPKYILADNLIFCNSYANNSSIKYLFLILLLYSISI